MTLFEVACSKSLNDSTRLSRLFELAMLHRHDGGDFIELGVYHGGSALLLAFALDGAAPERRVHLCDSWEGLPAHTPEDGNCFARAGMFLTNESHAAELLATHALAHRAVLHKGDIAKTLPKLAGPFALAHIDLDLYEGTRVALEHLLPRMLPGGAVVVDDYGTAAKRRFPGVERAVSEALRDSEWQLRSVHGDRDHAALICRR